jgi:hypothetical protein
LGAAISSSSAGSIKLLWASSKRSLEVPNRQRLRRASCNFNFWIINFSSTTSASRAWTTRSSASTLCGKLSEGSDEVGTRSTVPTNFGADYRGRTGGKFIQ